MTVVPFCCINLENHKTELGEQTLGLNSHTPRAPVIATCLAAVATFSNIPTTGYPLVGFGPEFYLNLEKGA